METIKTMPIPDGVTLHEGQVLTKPGSNTRLEVLSIDGGQATIKRVIIGGNRHERRREKAMYQ